MKRDRILPAVLVASVGGSYESFLGLKLTGLLTADLAQATIMGGADSSRDAEQLEKALYRNRSCFAHAVSKWTPAISLELNVFSSPDLELKPRGTIQYCLLLRSRCNNRSEGLEMLLTHFHSLLPLLDACFPEAEFAPVYDEEELAALAMPFTPSYAAMLRDKEQSFSLAKPITRQLTGFGAAVKNDSQSDCLFSLKFPWFLNGDSQEKLIHFLLSLTHPVWICFRMGPAEVIEDEKSKLLSLVDECNAFISGTKESSRIFTYQLDLLQKHAFSRALAMGDGALQLAVLAFTLRPPDLALMTMLGNVITGLTARGDADDILRGGFQFVEVDPQTVCNSAWFPPNCIVLPEEAACAFRFPSPPSSDNLTGLPIKRFRSAFAHFPKGTESAQKVSLLGVNVHRSIRQPVYCRLEDRLRHMFILGMTGMGKSAFIEGQVLQDMRNGFGLCVVDPHGDLIDKLLGKIPSEREKDIILLDPLDVENPVGFNLLEWKTPRERDRIIDDLYQAMDRMYDMRQTGGPIFESNFRGMLRLLMGDRPDSDLKPTILEFPSLYLHESFRRLLTATSEDPFVKDFVEELERTGGEAKLENLAPYVTSKLNRFFQDEALRNIVGQESTAFDFREIMDERQILLIKLGKGRFGPYVSSLLASMIVGRFKNAAMNRADLPESERHPFFLYVDEFQNLPQDEFSELLAEARKYRLGLVLANQFTAQVQKSSNSQEDLLAALLGNVGIFVLFRVGIRDAELLRLAFYPTFSESDIKELPIYHAYVRLSSEGKVMPPFNIQSVLDKTDYNKSTAERIIRFSREKYGIPVTEVVKQIRRRRNVIMANNQK